MFFSSKIFRQVFIYSHIIICIFLIAIFFIAIPFLENNLYAIQEESAHVFLNSLIQRIDSESEAIDTFWQSTFKEQKKRLRDITLIKVNEIISRSEQYTDLVDIVENVSKFPKTMEFSENGLVWIMGVNGKILYHPDSKQINKSASNFRDYYGNKAYETIYKRAIKENSGFSDYWVDSKNGLISKMIFYKKIPNLGLIVISEVDIESVYSEVSSRQEEQISKINSLVKENKYRNSGEVCIFNGSKLIIAHPNIKYQNKKISEIDSKIYSEIEKKFSLDKKIQHQNNTGYFKAIINNKIAWIRYVDDYDWYLVLSVDEDELFQAVNKLKNLILFAAIIFLVLINYASLTIVKNISNSIRKLSDVAKKVKNGDLSVRSNVVSQNEIGELSISMNEMIHTIEQNTNSLAKLNIEFKQAKHAADESNQSKTRFLTAISHDLLQPLTSAKLFSSLLQLENLSNENADLVEKINKSLESAKLLISELVEISKLNSGSVKPKIESFKLNNVFQESEGAFAIIAQNANINFRVAKTSLCVNSDKQLLRHIINNLVSNAIRYTKFGSVLLGCRRTKDSVHIQVWDTGLGIPKHKQKEIFQEFVRVNSSDVVDEHRFGLGLAIVDRISKILGYKILLKSVVGKGSVFSVEVPMSNAKDMYLDVTEPKVNNLPASSLKGKTILCLENEIDILDAMDRLLTRWGCNTILATSGEEILDILESEDVHIDIILSDFHLGDDETGVDAIKQIFEITGKIIPAIIITADTSEIVKKNILKNNYSVLNKPIDPDTLYQKIIDSI